MNFPDCFTKAHLDSSFAGVEISQSWNDLALWEEFLNRATPRSIIELGTFKGGMATFLALQGIVRGIEIATVDAADHGARRELLEKLGVCVHRIDLLSSEATEEIAKLISSLLKPLVLFCDNGNKPEEWKRFVPLLSSGDYAAVHDWGTEFHEHNLNPIAASFLADEAERTKSMTRFFTISPD